MKSILSKEAGKLILAVISSFSLMLILFLSAYPDENFWGNFSLNLLTEVLGAFMVFFILRLNIKNMFLDLKQEVLLEKQEQQANKRILRIISGMQKEIAIAKATEAHDAGTLDGDVWIEKREAFLTDLEKAMTQIAEIRKARDTGKETS